MTQSVGPTALGEVRDSEEERKAVKNRCDWWAPILVCLALALGLGWTPLPARAASISLSPAALYTSNPGETISVTAYLNLEAGEIAGSFLVTLALNNDQEIFSVSNLSGPQVEVWFNAPAVLNSPGTSGNDEIRLSAFSYIAPVSGPVSLEIGSFDLTATGAPGTLDLVLHSPESYYQTNFITQQTFSGTVGSFTYGPEAAGSVYEAPMALLLGPALFAIAFLRGPRD